MNPYDSGFIRGKRYNPNSRRVGRTRHDYSLLEDAHSRAEVQEVIRDYSSNPSEFNIQIEHDYA